MGQRVWKEGGWYEERDKEFKCGSVERDAEQGPEFASLAEKLLQEASANETTATGCLVRNLGYGADSSERLLPSVPATVQ